MTRIGVIRILETIDVTVPKNPQEDFKKANLEAGLNKDSDPPVPAINSLPKVTRGITMKTERQ